MPNWLVERRFQRYPIQLPLAYKPGGPPSGSGGGGWTCDLSAGGACLELGERLRPQAVIQVRLRTVHGPIEVGAQVVWVGEPTSPTGGIPHGVIFGQPTPEQLQTLQPLPSSPSAAPQARVRLPVDFAVTCQPKRPVRAMVQGRAGDMSRGGMLLRFPEVLAPGTEVEVTLHTTTGPVRLTGEIVWVDRSGSAGPRYPPPVYEVFGETVWLDLPERRTPEEPPIRHGLQFSNLETATVVTLLSYTLGNRLNLRVSSPAYQFGVGDRCKCTICQSEPRFATTNGTRPLALTGVPSPHACHGIQAGDNDNCVRQGHDGIITKLRTARPVTQERLLEVRPLRPLQRP